MCIHIYTCNYMYIYAYMYIPVDIILYTEIHWGGYQTNPIVKACTILSSNLNSINLPIRLLYQLHKPPKWTTHHSCKGTAPVQVVKGTKFGGDFCVIWSSCHVGLFLCPVAVEKWRFRGGISYQTCHLPRGDCHWVREHPNVYIGNMVDTILPILWRAARC